MPRLVPEIDGASIVLLGSFNPAIFQPSWFAQHGLLRDAEAAEAEVEGISKEFSVFSVDWLRIQVLDSRFSAAASDSGHASVLRDLVIGTFKLLEHTPVKAMGLNRQMHFKLPSEDVWHLIGDTLAPKTHWSKLLHGRLGMRALTIEGKRKDATSEYLRFTVQPSSKTPFGIYFDSNEHFQKENGKGLEGLMQELELNWENSQTHALQAAQDLISGIIERRD